MVKHGVGNNAGIFIGAFIVLRRRRVWGDEKHRRQGFRHGSDGGDGSDKERKATTEQSDATLPRFPEPEEVKAMPTEALEKLVAENKAAIENYINQNRDNLPPAWGFHGGTKESNDVLVGSKGKEIHAPQKKREEKSLWAAVVTTKDADPSVIAADTAHAVEIARLYANPAHVSGPLTPGGVSVLDLSNESAQAARRANFKLPEQADSERKNLTLEQTPGHNRLIVGLNTSANVALGVIKNPEGHFAAGTFKGIIPESTLTRYDQLSREITGEPKREDAAKALRNQFMAMEGLRLLIKGK